jgi:hypothetical protein
VFAKSVVVGSGNSHDFVWIYEVDAGVTVVFTGGEETVLLGIHRRMGFL